jgi:signal transduction histidine kinase/CHASE3 domain sensor protein
VRRGLAPRVLLAGAGVVALLLAEFAVLGASFVTVGHTTHDEQRAAQSIAAATRLEKLLLDLETGARGYVITHDQHFLQPWRRAQTRLPAVSAELIRLDPGPRTRAIVANWQAYLHRYSIPLVAEETRDPQAARSSVAARHGKRLFDHIRALIDPYVADRTAAADADRRKVADVRFRSRMTLLAGSILAILLVSGLILYVLQVLVAPLRRAAVATVDVSAGREIALPENAPGEVGQLAVAFNEMSRTLAASRASLAEQNLDLERLANLLRAVLDATVDGILLSDREGTIQLANRPMIQLASEVGMTLGQNVVDNLLSIADRMTDPDAYRASMERLRDDPDQETLDEFELADVGRVFQGFTAPVRDERGAFAGRIWTLREVTQQRELDRLKDEFVATVSHELRTPLTSMMGFLEMVRDGEAGPLNAEQERFLAIVYRSSERLQRLVGDLLFVARLDAGGLQLQLDDVALHEVAEDVAESTSALARARDLELAVDARPVPPVQGDHDRIAQVIGNLLSNAVKFTPPGGRVDVRTFVAGDAAVLEVEDTGVGIPQAEQERLFERFFRSTTATQQAIPGTGLGLVIAKAIAEAHGGRIAVSSAAGQGTCFRFELPLVVHQAAV